MVQFLAGVPVGKVRKFLDMNIIVNLFTKKNTILGLAIVKFK